MTDEAARRADHPGWAMSAHPVRRTMEVIQLSETVAARLERAIVRFRVQSAHNLLDEAFGAVAPDVVARDLARIDGRPWCSPRARGPLDATVVGIDGAAVAAEAQRRSSRRGDDASPPSG